MIGIGVGIDYALFIVTRYREALHDGARPEAAVVHAIDTSGRAVLFAGSTVVISLLGLFLIGLRFIHGLAVGASLAVRRRDGRRDHVAARGARLRRASRSTGSRRRARAKPSTARRASGPAGAALVQRRPVARGDRRPRASSSCSRSRCSRCASASPTPATTRRRARRAGPTTCSPRASGPASTGRCSSWATRRARRPRRAVPQLVAAIARDARRRRGRPRPSPNAHGPPLLQVVPTRRPQDERDRARAPTCATTSCPTATRGTDLDVHVGGQTAVGVDLADMLGHRLPDLHRRRARPELPAADGRVPIAARAAQGRDHEPAVDRRGVRRDRRDLPVGLGRRASLGVGKERRSRRGSR